VIKLQYPGSISARGPEVLAQRYQCTRDVFSTNSLFLKQAAKTQNGLMMWDFLELVGVILSLVFSATVYLCVMNWRPTETTEVRHPHHTVRLKSYESLWRLVHSHSIERRRTARVALSVDLTVRGEGIVPKMIRMAVLGFVVLALSGRCVLAQDSETLYTKKCANCHAKDGRGHTAVASKIAVPDFRSKQIKDMSDTDIYNSIAHGTQHKEYPHAFLHIGLTEEQIQGLVKYIRTLSKQGTPHGTAKP